MAPAAGTLKPLAYTRPHSDAFCYPIPDLLFAEPLLLSQPNLSIDRPKTDVVVEIIFQSIKQ